MIKNAIKYLGWSILIGLLIGCAATKAPEQMDEELSIKATMPVKVKSYKIPQGIFRGVLYPSSNEKAFDVWTIQKGKECHHKVQADFVFSGDGEDVTQGWDISKNIGSANVEIQFEDKTNDRYLKIQLPAKKRQYSSSVVKYNDNQEVVLIMDISESISDSSGIFVYILLESDCSK